jgi:hypothetical protein
MNGLLVLKAKFADIKCVLHISVRAIKWNVGPVYFFDIRLLLSTPICGIVYVKMGFGIGQLV